MGVCRGMQKINHYLGGSLSPIQHHSSTKHKITLVENKYICEVSPYVNSFHDWGIMNNDLSGSMRAFAIAVDGSVEGAVHVELPWFGIMWHPERNIGTEQIGDIELFKKIYFSGSLDKL